MTTKREQDLFQLLRAQHADFVIKQQTQASVVHILEDDRRQALCGQWVQNAEDWYGLRTDEFHEVEKHSLCKSCLKKTERAGYTTTIQRKKPV